MRYRKIGLTPADLELDKDHIVGTAFTLGEDEISEEQTSAGDEGKDDSVDVEQSDSILNYFIISKDN